MNLKVPTHFGIRPYSRLAITLTAFAFIIAVASMARALQNGCYGMVALWAFMALSFYAVIRTWWS